VSAPESEPGHILAALLETLRARGVTETAVTGGLAFGAWVTPRHTKDFDLCAVVPEAAVEPLLARYDGVRVGPERIPSTIRLEFARWQVDLFVAKTAYDHERLRRAVAVAVLGVPTRVVTPEDLLIHKLIKLQDDQSKLLQDAADIDAILRTCALDQAYFDRWLPEAEARFLAEGRTLDSLELVARLRTLGRAQNR
jgi:hypothetical protein